MSKSEILTLFNGNMSALSRMLGISRQAVHKWPQDKLVPAWWVEVVESELGQIKTAA